MIGDHVVTDTFEHWDDGFESCSRDGCVTSFLCCPAKVQAQIWAAGWATEFCKIYDGFIFSELNVNLNNPEGLIHDR
jgi:hypothetical protein